MLAKTIKNRGKNGKYCLYLVLLWPNQITYFLSQKDYHDWLANHLTGKLDDIYYFIITTITGLNGILMNT